MKLLERLRRMKGDAVDRMQQLNALAKKDHRDFTADEELEYAERKNEAEEAYSLIAARENRLFGQPSGAEALRRQGAEAERLRSTGFIRDETDTRREAMVAGLLLRDNQKLSAELAEKGRPYANMSLLRIAEECLQAAGVSTRGMAPDTIARLALRGQAGTFTASENFGFENFGGGMAGVSDFPAIVANVANKKLRQAYEAAPRTFTEFCVQVTAQDFKPLNSIQLSDLAALQPVGENGEFHRTGLSDNKETYALATFGEIVSLTRKVIINDDLQAFTRVPALLGTAAARMESDTVWNLIIANANMADRIPLFEARHNNLVTTNALAVAGMIAARAKMRLQKGPKGTILNLVPKFVIVSAAQEGVASPIVNPQNLAATATTADVPAFLRTMVPIVEPRLDDAPNGTTTWYLVADPASISTIEYAYLAGQQGVFIEVRQGFDVDGVEIKARLDFGAAPVEFRGLQKNTQ
ncbi:MAG: hypothetical protein ABSC23_20045 [Bryobacteraceae bacterium]|jgi:hypothetical protein